MKRIFTLNMPFVLVTLFLSFHVHAEGLICDAGIQPDEHRLVFTSEKTAEDFVTSETSIVRFDKTYFARKYTTEIENFIIEGTIYPGSGLAQDLSITDRATGVIAKVQEHRLVSLCLSGFRDGKLTRVCAGCMRFPR